MIIDPNNAVVRLCVQGMEAEGQGDTRAAKEFFMTAWERSVSDLEAFIAAHYVARHQADPQQELEWNLVALAKSQSLPEAGVSEYLPSLHLNAGKSFEDLGRFSEAEKHYREANKYATTLADNGYGRMIKRGIQSGLERLAAVDR